ncbi:hypothetical protein J1605_014001 [Eschrichtius robustus]|uniref:Uncharacterized protein n=1 Tax=Eschrichtius robustus TaxID=9764 RepID=A0AB34GI17_ESCRO|nr:hypothetical protein J1605_014001 [Eschrichtius robustus]
MDDLVRGRVPDRVEPHISVTHVGTLLQVEGQPQQLLGDAQLPARDHLHGEGLIEQHGVGTRLKPQQAGLLSLAALPAPRRNRAVLLEPRDGSAGDRGHAIPTGPSAGPSLGFQENCAILGELVRVLVESPPAGVSTSADPVLEREHGLRTARWWPLS